MRVSEKMSFDQMRASVMRSQAEMHRAQLEASSGVRVARPSDDPINAARSVLLDQSIGRLDSMGRTADRATEELTIAESTLGTAGGYMVRIKELVIQSLDGIMSASERNSIAREIQGLRDELLGVANTKVGSNYIFGGYRTDTEPFLADGSFIGVTGEREAEVAPGHKIGMNLSGDAVFGTAGGQDLFATLDQLVLDLQADDTAAIETRLGELEPVREQLVDARAQAGERLLNLDAAAERRETLTIGYKESRAQAVEADTATSYIDFVQAQTGLQASISQAARFIENLSSRLF